MPTGGRHILHVFPGFDGGGSQMRTVQLMGMMPGGVRHSILAMDGGYRFTAQIPEGVEWVTLGTPPGLSFFKMGRYFRDLLVARRPDAVMTYNWGAIEMVLGCKRAGFSPLVHHEDGFGPEETDRYLLRRIWIRRWLLRAAQAVAVPSLVLRDLATERWRVDPARLHYLPNGVDLSRFRPAEHASDVVVIASVGHLRPEKNQRLLLEAFAKASCRHRARLELYGEGDQASALRALASRLGIAATVVFHGAVADTSTAYQSMDVFALSSRTEQMPLTVLEAMAAGLPVVSTDVGDVRAMVDPSNHRWITPKQDVAALAAALDDVVADAAARRAVGASNRGRAEAEFESQARYRAWLELYTSLGIF